MKALFVTCSIQVVVILSLIQPVLAQTIREATGANAAAIQTEVDNFRTDLGGADNGAVSGDQGSGRREINWDAVPDADSAAGRFPGDFFNTFSTRGAVITTGGDGFMVSADAANDAGTGVEFDNLNGTYDTAFSTFSAERLFTPLGSNILDINFFVAGSTTPATVTGFGAVFTDVDSEGVTKVEFFDVNGTELLEREVMNTSGDESLSFLGVSFETASVARVRITLGDGIVEFSGSENDTSQGGDDDIVVLDDFIYGEPTTVAPLAPLISSPSDGDTISTAHPTITGMAESGSTVEIFCDSTSLGTTTVLDTGSWSLTPATALTDGAHTITATATNSTGTSETSSEVGITVTSISGQPTAPVLTRSGNTVSVAMQSISNAIAYKITAIGRLKEGKTGKNKVVKHKVFFTNQGEMTLPDRKRNWTVTYIAIGNGVKSDASVASTI